MANTRKDKPKRALDPDRITVGPKRVADPSPPAVTEVSADREATPRAAAPIAAVVPAAVAGPAVADPARSPIQANPLVQMFKQIGPAPDAPVDGDHPSLQNEGVKQPVGTGANKALRRVEALGLRIAGNDYRTIAEQLGVSVKTAYYDVQEALVYLAKHERKMAERLRALELARCDAMQNCLWPDIEKGDAEAVFAAIKIMERRAKLAGLDAPTEVSVTTRPLESVQLSELHARASRIMQRLEARAGVTGLSPARVIVDDPHAPLALPRPTVTVDATAVEATLLPGVIDI